MQPEPRYRIRLALLPTGPDEGRRTPILSGYRPHWDVGNRNEAGETIFNDGGVLALAVEPLAPGTVAEAELVPVSPEYWPDLAPGTQIAAYEGRRRVATAEVLGRVVT